MNSGPIFKILIGKIPQSLTQSRKLKEIIRSRVKVMESVVKKGEKKNRGILICSKSIKETVNP